MAQVGGGVVPGACWASGVPDVSLWPAHTHTLGEERKVSTNLPHTLSHHYGDELPALCGGRTPSLYTSPFLNAMGLWVGIELVMEAHQAC